MLFFGCFTAVSMNPLGSSGRVWIASYQSLYHLSDIATCWCLANQTELWSPSELSYMANTIVVRHCGDLLHSLFGQKKTIVVSFVCSIYFLYQLLSCFKIV
jgi:hypothetical protein